MAENSRLEKDACRTSLGGRCDQRRFRPKVVTPAATQAAVEVMVNDYCLSKVKACKLVDLSRTVLYRPKVDRIKRDGEVIAV